LRDGNRARVRRKDRVGRRHGFRLLQDRLLHAKVFEHRLDDEIDVAKSGVVGRPADERHVVIELLAGDLFLR
jgi:hypothetical protein